MLSSGEHYKLSVEERKLQTDRILEKYPDKVCIYIERGDKSDDIPNITKHKYLVPNTLTIAQFTYIIRKRLNLNGNKAFFLIINNVLLSGNLTLGEVYNKYKSDDGFVYIKYSGENCFG